MRKNSRDYQESKEQHNENSLSHMENDTVSYSVTINFPPNLPISDSSPPTDASWLNFTPAMLSDTSAVAYIEYDTGASTVFMRDNSKSKWDKFFENKSNGEIHQILVSTGIFKNSSEQSRSLTLSRKKPNNQYRAIAVKYFEGETQTLKR